MKNLLRLEELAQFLACLITFIVISAPWWVYVLLIIGPDIGMLGYLVSNRVGAVSYNLLHHKLIAIVVGLLVPYLIHEFAATDGWIEGLYSPAVYSGIILYGHASMDRIFGYGLKFGDNFHHTHLGWIGKLKGKEQEN